MTRRQRYKPLWADLPPDEPDPYADVTSRWTYDQDEPESADPAPQEPGRGRAIGLAAASLVAGVLVVLAMTTGSAFSVQTVPSGWGDIPMRCETVRVDDGDHALETFSCRATDSSRLPPGRYESPDSQWTSDITREDARASVVEISGDGKLSGVAVFGPATPR